MNKKLLSLAVAAMIAAPAAMASDVTVYGVGHMAITHYDTNGTTADTNGAWDLASHASRLGVKGSEDLGNGLKAIFKMEFAVRMADNEDAVSVTNNAESVAMRNSYVGLAGDWGTFLMGRHDTPMKISTGSLDLFADTIADYNGNAADDDGPVAATAQGLTFEDIRADNAVAYVSPNMNGFTVAGAFVTAGGDEDTAATGADGSDLAEAYSIAAMYSNGPFFASLAYEAFDDQAIATALGHADNKWRAGLGYNANNLTVGFVYEDQERTATEDRSIWQLSGSYAMGNNVLKVAYGEQDSTTATGDLTQWSLGVDHNMSKRTKLYGVYSDVDVDSPAATSDWSGLSFGMVHSF